MKFPGGATSLGFFLKAYRTSKTKNFFQMIGLIHLINSWMKRFHRMITFLVHSPLRNCNPVEKNHSNYQEKLIDSGCISETALKKLKLTEISPTGQDYHAYLQQVWNSENVQSIRDFLRWYNNRDRVTTVEMMKKWSSFITITGLTC